MNFLSVKKIRLFKKSSAQRAAPPPSPLQREGKLNLWQQVIHSPFTFVALFVLILAYFISFVPSKSLPALQEGDIATADIIAPSDITIIDKETTEKRRKEAEAAVLPVYSLDQNVFLNTEEKIREFFNLGRTWREDHSLTTKNLEEFKSSILEKFDLDLSLTDLSSLARTNFTPEIEDSLINLIGKISSRGIILSKNLFIHGEQEKGFTLMRSQGIERIVKAEEILDSNESKQSLTAEINKLELSQRNKSFLIALSHAFIVPNISYNKVETDFRKNLAQARIETVFYTIKKGKVIIRKGDEVTKDALKQVSLINQNLKAKPSWLTNFAGIALLLGLLFISLWFYLKSLLEIKVALKNFLMMGILLVLSLLLCKLVAFFGRVFSQSTSIFLFAHAESYWYALPYQIGTLIFAFLTTNQLALIYSVINSLLVGYLFQGNFTMMIFAFLGGLAAIYGVSHYRRSSGRGSTLRAGTYIIAPANIFLIITFHLIRETLGSLGIFTSEVIMGLLGSVLGASLAFLLLPVFEYLFKFVTPEKLLELTNSDLPIFRQMAIEAPGTYHHSLVVASLSEKAAEELQLDPMLIKAGALYHDIGKIKMPEYFIENQARNPNIHKDLTPSMSALVIVNHVKEGTELARKSKLPQMIREIIEQHHGSSLVKYFYQKAKEQYDPEMQKIEEERYRYPGPPPQSKEAALVLLADSVEAASRSLKTPARENLKRVIKDIFENTLQDEQLDQCDFSLKELRTVASSFLSTLYSIYHPRVEYPGFDFELKNKIKSNKKQNNNDRNHQHSEEVPDKPK